MHAHNRCREMPDVYPPPPPAAPAPATPHRAPAGRRSPRTLPSDPAIVASQPIRRRIAAVCRPRMNRPGSVTIAGFTARQSSVDLPPDQPGGSRMTSASPATPTIPVVRHRRQDHAVTLCVQPAGGERPAEPFLETSAVSARVTVLTKTNRHAPTASAMRGKIQSYRGRYLNSDWPDQNTGDAGSRPSAARSIAAGDTPRAACNAGRAAAAAPVRSV